jgi:trehalose 6-phosphate phosphatase
MPDAAMPPPAELDPAAIALFLDVDGTLVEIERQPDAVHVPERLRAILSDLQRASGGALAVVSGRTLVQLDRLFAPLRLSAAGLHGLERRHLGATVVRANPDPAILGAARAQLAAFAERHPGVLLEDKGLTLALHYRNAPAQQAAATATAEAAVAASGGALVLLRGKMVLELKPPGGDKGQAIAAFLGEPPFAGRQPVFAGDDLTDEPGFVAVNQRRGITIRVGADALPTAARYRQPDVSAMQRWLAGLLRNSRALPAR